MLHITTDVSPFLSHFFCICGLTLVLVLAIITLLLYRFCGLRLVHAVAVLLVQCMLVVFVSLVVVVVLLHGQ